MGRTLRSNPKKRRAIDLFWSNMRHRSFPDLVEDYSQQGGGWTVKERNDAAQCLDRCSVELRHDDDSVQMRTDGPRIRVQFRRRQIHEDQVVGSTKVLENLP